MTDLEKNERAQVKVVADRFEDCLNYPWGPYSNRITYENRILIAAALHRLAGDPGSVSKENKLVAALEWYGKQARLARLIHREGDAGREALQEDGGNRARDVLASVRGAA